MWCVFCARFGAGGVAYFSCGRVPIAGCVFCVWLSPVDQCVAGFLLRGCILRTAAVCCVVREVWPNGPVACFAYGQGLLCGAYSRCGWAPLLLGVLSASGFPVCFEVDNSPLFNFNRIFSPFLGARAETLRRNLLFEGTMLMPSDLGLCYFMRGP